MSAKIEHKNPDAIQKIYERMKGNAQREVAVGYPAGKCQAYPDGTAVAPVAAFHVYGMGVPRRDFMGLARDEIIQKAIPILKKSVQQEDKENAERLREAAGTAAVTAIQHAIIDLKDPPNAPGTLHPSVGGTNPNGKKSDNPLVDTMHMHNTTTYVVREKK